MDLLTIFVTVVSLTGTILNTYRNKWGQAFWCVSNLYWVVYDFKMGAYAQGFLFFVYFLLSVKGMLVWSKKERNE